jgi:hypothetical protein
MKKNLPDAREVKRAADFVAIVSRYTRLRPSGRQFVGICPFHDERHPSFYVHPEKKLWFCFGCGRGGDVFKFVMCAECCGFSAALRIISAFGGSARQRAHEVRECFGGREGGERGARVPAARAAGASHSPHGAEHARLAAKLAATERRISAICAANDAVPLSCAADRADFESRSRRSSLLEMTG